MSEVIGWREWLGLPELLPGGERVKAKIDTGARTSAIHAWDVETVDRNGVAWLRFSLHPRQDDDTHIVTAEARHLDQREIRSSNGEVEVRDVVSTLVRVGDASWPIELTLTNRDQMGFRMLLGRTAMADRLLVDPGRSFVTGRHADGGETAMAR